MNQFLGTVIVMPMTSSSQKTRFRLQSSFEGIEGLLLGDQIRSVAKQRLVKHLGRVDAAACAAALAILREMFQE
jgi:mRNA interferase MazF